MNISKYWTFYYVLLVIAVNLSTMAEDDEDFSDIEKLLHHYHKFENADLLKWKWSDETFCKAIRPGRIGITHVTVEKREIMLESINCTKIEAELLTCAGQGRDPTTIFIGWSAVFLSGPWGEIYEVYSPFEKTKCDDPKTFTIQRAVVRGGNGSGQIPRLWGVDEIFEELSLEGFNVRFQSGRRRKKNSLERPIAF